MSIEYVKENNADCIALTYNGKIVDYVITDQAVDEWISQGKEYDWFPVEY